MRFLKMGSFAKVVAFTIIGCASVGGFNPPLNKHSKLPIPKRDRLSLSARPLSSNSGDKGCNGEDNNPKENSGPKHPMLREFNLSQFNKAPSHKLMSSARSVYGPLRTEYQNIYQKLSKFLLFLQEQKDEISLNLLYTAFKESSLDKLNLFIKSINKNYNISSNFFINHQEYFLFVQKLCSKQSTAYSFLAMILNKDAWVLPMKSRTLCPDYHTKVLEKLAMFLKKSS
jgi:hypothetical protein